MAIHPLVAAKFIAEASEWTKSNLEINKLVYLAHMIHLGWHGDNCPLITSHFEACDYGPLCPRIYNELKVYGAKPVKNIFRRFPNLGESSEKEALQEVYGRYGSATPGQLVGLTNSETGAWAAHYKPKSRGIIIPDCDIHDEYIYHTK